MSQQVINASAAKKHTALPLVSVGRVKRSYAVGATTASAVASNDASYRAAATSSDELSAWARRASAANGFGEAAETMAPTRAVPAVDATHPMLDARAQRYANLFEMVRAATAAAARAARRWVSAWQRRRAEHETFRALRALDARTLHDLGLDASELRSVAMEISGETDPTRAHALMRLKFLLI
jgi:uncharacterized protein YjiS (DUF1127 family)